MDSASIAPGVMTARPTMVPHVPPHIVGTHVSTPHIPTPVVARPLPIPANDVHAGSAIAAGENVAKQAQPKAASAEEQRLTAMEKRAGKLSTVGFVLGIPFMLEGLGQMASMVGLNRIPGIRNAGKFKTGLSTVFVAGPRAMRDTQLKDMLHLRANYLGNVSDVAAKNGATTWSTNAARKAEMAAQAATSRGTWVADKLSPLRSAGGKALDHVGGTGIGGTITNWLNGGAKWRMDKVGVKHTAAMDKALAASRGELPGFMDRVKGFFSRKAATTVGEAMPAELAHYASRIEAAKGLSGAARADHLAETARTLHKAVHGSALEGEAATRGMSMLTHVEKAAGSASALHSYEQAAGGTLRNVAKAAFSAVGRAPVFGTLIAAGAVAGISAHMINGRITTAKREKLYQQFAGAAGGEQSEYMHNVRAADRQQGRTDMMRTGLNIVNEASNVAFATLPGGGGVALGVGQMATLPAEKLLSDNPIVDAYSKLKKAEAGEIQLSDADQLNFTRHLLTATPALANPKSGGYYNHENGPTARALIAKYPTVDERVAVMADAARFDAFLKETKQASAEAAKASAANDDGHANADIDVKPKTAVEAKYHAAEKPGSAQISALAAGHGTEAHGRVVNAHRQVG